MLQVSIFVLAGVRWLWLVAALVACGGPSGSLAPTAAKPARAPAVARTSAALHADQLFWQVFHRGAYDEITGALRALGAAYLADPHDAVTAAHIGWLHSWRLAERARRGRPDPLITDDAVLGRRYFERAVQLAPDEPRYAGFYASMLLTESALHDDEELRRRGSAAMADAVAAWPEFNWFTAGYGPSGAPHQSARFRAALDAQWHNLEVCLGRAVDRRNPDVSRAPRPRAEGAARACTNSDIAPHNSEGFYLNFGDMLVKAGEPAAGVVMYRNAQAITAYPAWPYREVLEARIRDAAANVAVFRGPAARDQPVLMIDSAFACMACHQQ